MNLAAATISRISIDVTKVECQHVEALAALQGKINRLREKETKWLSSERSCGFAEDDIVGALRGPDA
ncbi:MAG: hypothetical protein AB7I19_11430 [Planctomycetota bacterium]